MLFTRKKFTSLGLITVLYFASFAAMCDKAKDAQRAAVAASRIQTVIDTTVDSTSQLFHDGIIKKELAHNIGLGLQKTNNANRVLISTAKAMNSDNSTNRCLLATNLLNVANAVKELKELGVLGIKSINGQLVFDTAISSIIANIKILAAIIGPCAESVTNVVAKLEKEINNGIFSSNNTD